MPVEWDPRPSLRTLTGYLERLAGRPEELTERQQTKCYGELALIHHYVSRWVREGALPREPFERPLASWTASLAAHCERIPHQSLYHFQPYLWLRATGYRSATAETALARLARSGARPDSIGEYYSLWKAGLAPRPPNWRAALPRWLAEWGDSAERWEHSDYLITHAAFYVTDFGTRAAPVEPSDEDRLAHLNQELLHRAVDRACWDLAGECLIALAFLGRDDTYVHRRATRAFCRARQAGWSSYHTSIVDILACAVALRTTAR